MSAPSDLETSAAVPPAQTFTEAVLGREVTGARVLARWRAIDPDRRVALAVALLGTLLFVPYLGAVGLWDPWETHYGEVARAMAARGDYVYPWWESVWFFSKPPLTLWLQALGMNAVGAQAHAGALGRYTEWGMRLPFALLSIGAASLLAYALSRVVSRRVGLAAGFVLCTMPLFYLLTRQTVTDTPFVSLLTAAMACGMVGQLDARTRQRSAWWYGFYVLTGAAVLAKGLPGALSFVILGVYALLGGIHWAGHGAAAHVRWLWDARFRARVREGAEPMPALWAQFFHMRLGTGLLVFLAVALPWYLTLCLFQEVDEDGHVFWYRFFIHDHLNRLTAGVHTTTPGGTFTYFLEQGGYAIFPWVAAVPGALAVVNRLRLRAKEGWHHAALIGLLWTVLAWLLVGASATKFHHYVFPILPGLAILIALWVDRLWEEGPQAHVASLVLGAALFILVGKDLASHPKVLTDLFVYNYDRPYPVQLIDRPIALFASRPLWAGDLLALALLALGGFLFLDAPARKGARAGAVLLLLAGLAVVGCTLSGGALPASALVGAALVLGAGAMAWAARVEPAGARSGRYLEAGVVAVLGLLLLGRGLSQPAAQDGLTRALTQPENVKAVLGAALVAAFVLAAWGALRRQRTLLFATGWVLAAGLAVWINWDHWVSLSHHWTQRDLFWRYYGQRQEGEPIAAYLMNWRGETFYSRNTVVQVPVDDATGRIQRFVAPAGREWVLVEHARLGLLRQAVGPGHVVTPVDKDLNNKFVLVTVD